MGEDLPRLVGELEVSVEHLIVGATGVGYFIVGVLQLSKGAYSNAIIWLGYSIGQIGLWMNIK